MGYGPSLGEEIFAWRFWHAGHPHCQVFVFYVQLNIHKVVSAKRASALVAALEPPEQTNRVECVLAGGATLVRRLHVG